MTASIYDDINDDGIVAFEIKGKLVFITESPHWHVQGSADIAWVLPTGQVNPNLRFRIDGYITRYMEWGETAAAVDWARANAITNGVVDWEVEIVDMDANGIPDYQLQRLINDFPAQYSSVFRATLYVNPHQQPAEPYENVVIWPLLVSRHGYESYNYFDHPPVVAVNWEDARIERVGILGYPIEHGYHINSTVAWAKGQDNYANFENPMAYYDLASDKDGMSELFVRFEVFDKDDVTVLGRYGIPNPMPLTHVEYTWDGDNDGRWNYELGLAARFPISTVIPYADFSVRSVPYEDIPPWVMSQHWDIAIFFAEEDGGYWNSEGMGEWGPNRGYLDGAIVEPSGLRDLYLTGISDTAPVEYYQEIASGFRGEISLDYGSKPLLYINPVDRRLHLFRAMSGIWTIDDGKTIQMTDQTGDGFFDQWQYRSGESLQSQLNLIRDHLVFIGLDAVIIKQLRDVKEPILVLPPTTHEEWMRLGELTTPRPAFLADADIDDVLAQFAEPILQFSGASARQVRLTPNGYRFVLELQPGFGLTVDAKVLEEHIPTPGSYVLAYNDGDFSIQALTPPALRFGWLRFGPADGSLQEWDWATVSVDLYNDGLEDVHDLPVCATLTDPDEHRKVFTDTVSLLPGEGSVSLAWDWAPDAAGTWTARVETGCDSQDLSAALRTAQETHIEVDARPVPGAAWFLSLGGRIPGSVFLVLAAAALFAGGLAFFWAREHQRWL